MNNQNLCVFIPSLRGGGAERAMIILSEGFIALGYQVDLVVCSAQGPLAEILPESINLIDLGKPRAVAALLPLVAYLKEQRPCALFSTIPHANVIALLATIISQTDTPVVVRESNSPQTELKKSFSRKVVHFLTPWFYKKARGIIAVSEGVKNELIAMSATLKAQISVVPTPVVTDHMLVAAEEALDHPWFSPDFKEPIIVAAGRLHPQKDFSMLLRAFQLLVKQTPARLVILGEGDLRKSLESLAQDLNIDKFVSMPGFVVNPFPFLKKARVFVLSSKYEGMPNVLLQALALGTPVVATDCHSGPRECLRGGAWGTLVPVGDVQAMSQALLQALEQTPAAETAQYIRSQYSHVGAARSYLAVAGIS
jgi:glycosyltransferase involved in cell wall biosynthesis